MKKMMIKIFVSGAVALAIATNAWAQKTDQLRMERDIEVAENVLSTLIKQQFEQQRMFFPLEITGYYQQGYGVTFRLPADYTTPIVLGGGSNNTVIWQSESDAGGYNYTVGSPSPAHEDEEFDNDNRPQIAPKGSSSLKDRTREKERTRKRLDMDSVQKAYNNKIIEAAKSFIIDYGDLISQLSPTERIVITNQGDRPRMWVNQYFNNPKRTHLSIEGSKSDIIAFKQGKLSREQAMAKVSVVNTESSDKVEPDMELLSSIFNRLYRMDLSKTFFTEDNIYYERLNNFGALYYMQVFSTIPADRNRFSMPTLGLEDVDMATREKKVKEIYPQFEKELIENIVEYGKTLKTLKDDESLIFNVTLTKCVNCGIPQSIEVSVKGAVLKDLSAGKLDKSAAINKVVLKKGASQ